eukprot:2565042-Pleurochrysis_carterae.AAC.1
MPLSKRSRVVPIPTGTRPSTPVVSRQAEPQRKMSSQIVQPRMADRRTTYQSPTRAIVSDTS